MCPVLTITADVKKFTFFIIISKEVALSVSFLLVFSFSSQLTNRGHCSSCEFEDIEYLNHFFSVLVLVKLQLRYGRDYFGSSHSCTVCTIRDILQLGCRTQFHKEIHWKLKM